MTALFNGIGLGLVLSIMIGPVFFGLLKTSLNEGFRKGILYALGVSASDILLILLCYFGVSSLLQKEYATIVLAFAGGIIMLGFGISYLRKAPVTQYPEATQIAHARITNQSLKGFIINLVSPSVLLFWFTTVSGVSIKYGNQSLQLFLFFSGIIVTLLLADIFKAYLAGKLKDFITPANLNIMNKIVGLIFIIAGLLFLYRGFGTVFPHI